MYRHQHHHHRQQRLFQQQQTTDSASSDILDQLEQLFISSCSQNNTSNGNNIPLFMTKDDLQNLCQKFSISLESAEYCDDDNRMPLFEALDRDQDGKISLPEFLNGFCASYSECPTIAIEKIVQNSHQDNNNKYLDNYFNNNGSKSNNKHDTNLIIDKCSNRDAGKWNDKTNTTLINKLIEFDNAKIQDLIADNDKSNKNLLIELEPLSDECGDCLNSTNRVISNNDNGTKSHTVQNLSTDYQQAKSDQLKTIEKQATNINKINCKRDMANHTILDDSKRIETKTVIQQRSNIKNQMQNEMLLNNLTSLTHNSFNHKQIGTKPMSLKELSSLRKNYPRESGQKESWNNELELLPSTSQSQRQNQNQSTEIDYAKMNKHNEKFVKMSMSEKNCSMSSPVSNLSTSSSSSNSEVNLLFCEPFNDTTKCEETFNSDRLQHKSNRLKQSNLGAQIPASDSFHLINDLLINIQQLQQENCKLASKLISNSIRSENETNKADYKELNSEGNISTSILINGQNEQKNFRNDNDHDKDGTNLQMDNNVIANINSLLESWLKAEQEHLQHINEYKFGPRENSTPVFNSVTNYRHCYEFESIKQKLKETLQQFESMNQTIVQLRNNVANLTSQQNQLKSDYNRHCKTNPKLMLMKKSEIPNRILENDHESQEEFEKLIPETNYHNNETEVVDNFSNFETKQNSKTISLVSKSNNRLKSLRRQSAVVCGGQSFDLDKSIDSSNNYNNSNLNVDLIPKKSFEFKTTNSKQCSSIGESSKSSHELKLFINQNPKQYSGLQSEYINAQQRINQQYFKVIFIGDSNVGKTSFINRAADGTFMEQFSPTIGIDFKIKSVMIDGELIELQLWDTAGQERYRSITSNYYRKVDGICLMYDVNNEQTFLNVRNWIGSIQDASGFHSQPNLSLELIPMLILGNKIDIRKHQSITNKTGEQFTRTLKIKNCQFMETSAKTGFNVEQILVQITRLMANCHKKVNVQNSIDSVELNTNCSNLKRTMSCCRS